MIGTWRLRETLAGSRPKPSFSDLSVRPIVKNYWNIPSAPCRSWPRWRPSGCL